MFTNVDGEVIGFSSFVNTQRNTTEGGVQTTEFSISDVGTSTNIKSSSAIQTDNVCDVDFVRPSTPPNLAAWLVKIAPMVLEELEFDDPFQGYDPYGDDSFDEAKCNLIQTIDVNNEKYSLTPTALDRLPVTSLAWSSAGSTLAIAYGQLYHNDWCQHDGRLHIYRIRGRTEELVHLHNLETSSCITTVVFHPTEPALLASATFNGEISIWNLQYLHDGTNRDILLSTNASEHSGKTIGNLLWLSSEQINYYFKNISNISLKVLISAGSDGRIIIWTVDTTESICSVHNSFDVRSTTVENVVYTLDIGCFDLYNCRYIDSKKYDEDYMIIGGKTGEVIVFRPSNAKYSQHPYERLQSHDASIISVKFSQNNSKTFFTFAADREMRIYDVTMVSPIKIVFADSAALLVDSFPSVNRFISAGDLTSIKELRINRDNVEIKSIAIEASIEKDINGLSAMALNKKFVNRLAIGYLSGAVKIWNVPFNKT